MEKKFIVAVALLSVGLFGGIWVLIQQNGGIGEVSASLADSFSGKGNEWVQIQPRTALQANDSDDISNSATDEQTPSKSNPKAVKAQKAVVVWCNPATAANKPAGNIIIGEVAWMGTEGGYSDEWLELKNLSASAIDLSGWQLQNKNQKLKIVFGAADIVSPQGVYLLERTDDETIPGISAAKIYTGSLANSNEALYLFDAACNLQDMVAALPEWPAGNNSTKQTMVRLPSLGWADSVVGGGTPGIE